MKLTDFEVHMLASELTYNGTDSLCWITGGKK